MRSTAHGITSLLTCEDVQPAAEVEIAAKFEPIEGQIEDTSVVSDSAAYNGAILDVWE